MIVIIDYGMGNLRSVSKALESLGASVRVSSDPADIARADKLILPGVGAFPAAMRELNARGLIDPIKAAISSGKPYLGICLGLQLLFEYGEEGGGAAGLGILRGNVRHFAFPRLPNTAHMKIPHMGWNEVVRPQWKDIPSEIADRHIEVMIRHSGGNPIPVTVRVRHIPTGLEVTCHGKGDSEQCKEKALYQLRDRVREHFRAMASADNKCPLLHGIPNRSFFYFVHSYYAEPTERSIIALEAEYGWQFAAMVWRDNLYATQFHPEKSQTVGLHLLKNFVGL